MSDPQKVDNMQDRIASLENRVAEVEGQLASQRNTSNEVDTVRSQLNTQRSEHSKVLEECRKEKRDAETKVFELKITQLESEVKIVTQGERDAANNSLQSELIAVQKLGKDADNQAGPLAAAKARIDRLVTELANVAEVILKQPVDNLPARLHHFSSIIRRFKELEALQGSSLAVTAPIGWDNLQFDYHPVEDPNITALRMWYQMTSAVHSVDMVYRLEPDLRILAILEDAVHNQLLKANWTSETTLAWLRAVEYLTLCYRTDRLNITLPEVTDILHAALIRRIQDTSKAFGAYIEAESMDVEVKLIPYGQDLIVIEGDYTRVVGRANFALVYPAMDGYIVVRNYRNGQEGRWMVDETDQIIGEQLARLFPDACDRSDDGNALFDLSGGQP